MHLTANTILETTVILAISVGYVWMASKDFQSLRKRPDRPEHDHFG
jgi:hypothetical protein